jgi:polynucleotide 5'-kinase involved in rRNA processing
VRRLPAVRLARPRSAAARKRHREVALARYCADARTITVDATRVAVRSLTGEPATLDTLVAGTLVALHGEDGETLAIGLLEGVDPARGALTVKTPRTASSPRVLLLVKCGEQRPDGGRDR